MCAKSTLPFGGASATKSFGKTLTFYRRGTRQKVKKYGVPAGAPSAAQIAQRESIKQRVEAWQSLSALEKTSWNNQALLRGDPWSGYTLFMSTWEAVMNFTDLLDAFSSYVGKAGKIIQIKVTEDGLEAVEPGNIFLDNFDDDELHWGWRTDNLAGDRTVTESGGVLTIAIDSGTSSDWWSTVNNCPKIITGLRGFPCEIICKINSYTSDDSRQAGLFVAYDAVGAGSQYAFMYARSAGGVSISTTGTALGTVAVLDFPIWLRIKILADSSSNRGGRLIFSYSTDGESWTDQLTYDTWPYNPGVCGLFAKTWGTNPGISVPFEFFKVAESMGPG